MHNVKQKISEWLRLEKASLNEISIEDIKLADIAQQKINKTVTQLTSYENENNDLAIFIASKPDEIPCKSYWIEKTKDLVLYIWKGNKSRAIVVPSEGWKIRKDMTIH